MTDEQNGILEDGGVRDRALDTRAPWHGGELVGLVTRPEGDQHPHRPVGQRIERQLRQWEVVLEL